MATKDKDQSGTNNDPEQVLGDDERRKEALKRLREPFPDNQISLLPKPTLPAEEMKKIEKGHCEKCGGYHAVRSIIHLPYVGHAALTDRLLDVDPFWNWVPLTYNPDGTPYVDKDGGMWIKLTVCGVTRLGYGDSGGKTGPNAMKERIGDALRNAAMRGGCALELWHKGGDLHAHDEAEEEFENAKLIIKETLENTETLDDLIKEYKTLWKQTTATNNPALLKYLVEVKDQCKKELSEPKVNL